MLIGFAEPKVMPLRVQAAFSALQILHAVEFPCAHNSETQRDGREPIPAELLLRLGCVQVIHDFVSGKLPLDDAPVPPKAPVQDSGRSGAGVPVPA